MSYCRSCKAKIEWVELESGKMHPVDPDSISARDCELGDRLVTDDGMIITIKAETDDDLHGYVSHFSTCPDADHWRNKK